METKGNLIMDITLHTKCCSRFVCKKIVFPTPDVIPLLLLHPF
jgi:hypothetical protein